MFNFCFDSCQWNTVPRRTIQDGFDQKTGKPKNITQVEEGKNKKLCCELGYLTTVNSKEALKNAIKNGSQICRQLKKVFN